MSSSEFAYGTERVGHYSGIDTLSLSRTNSDESRKRLAPCANARIRRRLTQGNKPQRLRRAEPFCCSDKAGGSKSQAVERGGRAIQEYTASW